MDVEHRKYLANSRVGLLSLVWDRDAVQTRDILSKFDFKKTKVKIFFVQPASYIYRSTKRSVISLKDLYRLFLIWNGKYIFILHNNVSWRTWENKTMFDLRIESVLDLRGLIQYFIAFKF